MRVFLGARDVDARMQRFLRTYGNALRHQEQSIDYADARYTSGIAVRFKPEVRHEDQLAGADGGFIAFTYTQWIIDMASEKHMQRIVALDIGTNKIAAIVANVNPQGELEIIGIGTHQSRGLKKGVVVNIDSTVQSIQRAVEEAELMSGCEIDSVYVGIAGSHIRSLNSHGIVAVRDREVFSLDIDRVIDAAKAMAIPADQKILHVLPQEYIIDSQEGVKEPLGYVRCAP